MADNTTLSAAVGTGDTIVNREISHAGDTAKLQGVFLMGITGTEGAYTAAAIDGDATNGIDVDVTRVTPGTGASNLGKAEDAAHSSGDVGVMAMTVRQDTAAALSGTDGDYQPLISDGSGRLHVNVGNTVTVGSHEVTNAGTFAVQVDGTALTRLTDIETNTDSCAVVGNGLAATAQRVTLASDSTGVIGTVTAVTAITNALPAGTNNIGDVDVLTVPAPLSTTGGGTEATALRVTVASDSTGVLSVDDNGGSLTVDGTVAVSGTVAVTQSGTWDEVGINDSGNSITVDNGGTFAVQVDGSALTALQKIDDPVLVDDAAFTPATSSVMMAGFEADETATDSVDEGDAGAARMTLDRKQIVNPQPHTAGGLSIFRSLDIDETEEEIKATAGQVYGWYIFNAVASVRYVKFYNATAANVTVGTTTPVLTLPVPTSSTNGVGFVFNSAMGITFDTAITVACTTALADNDATAPGANDVQIVVLYK